MRIKTKWSHNRVYKIGERSVITRGQQVDAAHDISIKAEGAFDNTKGTVHAGRNAFSDSKGETTNLAGIFRGDNYAQMTAEGNIYNTSDKNYVPGPYDYVLDLVPGKIIGGAGEGFDGVGVYVESQGCIYNDASDVYSIGHIVMKGRLGIIIQDEAHTFLQDKYTKRTGFMHHHKETVRVYATQVFGNDFISEHGRIFMSSSEGQIIGHAANFLGAQGTELTAKGPINLYDVISRHQVVKTSHSFGGLFHDKSTHTDESSISTKIACPENANVIIHSEESDVNMVGTDVFGAGHLEITGRNVNIEARKLNHSDSHKGTGLSVAAFQQDLYDSLSESSTIDWHKPRDTFYDSLKQLADAGDEVEFSLAMATAGMEGIESANWLMDAIRNNQFGREMLDRYFAPQASVGVTKMNQESHYQTIGKGGINVGSLTIKADETVTFKAAPVHTSGDAEIVAKKFEQIGIDLESDSHSSSSTASIGFSLKGPSAKAEYSEQSSHSDHFVNQQFDVGGKLKIEVETWEMDGANTNVKTLEGKADNLIITTHVDHANTTQSAGSLSTQGAVSASHSESDSSTVSQASGLHVVESITDDNFKVKNLEGTAGYIISDNKVDLHPETAVFHDLNESVTSKGESLSLNVNSIAKILQPTASTQFDKVGVGISNSNYETTLSNVIYGAGGTDFSAEKQEGNVHTESADGRVVDKDSNHNYNANIPIAGNNVIEHFEENVQWFFGDTSETKNERADLPDKIIVNTDIVIPIGDYCSIPEQVEITEIPEPVPDTVEATISEQSAETDQIVDVENPTVNIKLTEQDKDTLFSLPDFLSLSENKLEEEEISATPNEVAGMLTSLIPYLVQYNALKTAAADGFLKGLLSLPKAIGSIVSDSAVLLLDDFEADQFFGISSESVQQANENWDKRSETIDAVADFFKDVAIIDFSFIHSEAYQNARDRMEDREQTLLDSIDYLSQLPFTKQVELGSEAISSLVFGAAALKVTSIASELVEVNQLYGTFSEIPQFYGNLGYDFLYLSDERLLNVPAADLKATLEELIDPFTGLQDERIYLRIHGNQLEYSVLQPDNELLNNIMEQSGFAADYSKLIEEFDEKVFLTNYIDQADLPAGLLGKIANKNIDISEYNFLLDYIVNNDGVKLGEKYLYTYEPSPIEPISLFDIRSGEQDYKDLMFVVTPENKLLISARDHDHWGLAGGGPVRLAGELGVENGKITTLNYQSGTFKPSVEVFRPDWAEHFFSAQGYEEVNNIYVNFETQLHDNSVGGMSDILTVSSYDERNFLPTFSEWVWGSAAGITTDIFNIPTQPSSGQVNITLTSSDIEPFFAVPDVLSSSANGINPSLFSSTAVAEALNYLICPSPNDLWTIAIPYEIRSQMIGTLLLADTIATSFDSLTGSTIMSDALNDLLKHYEIFGTGVQKGVTNVIGGAISGSISFLIDTSILFAEERGTDNFFGLTPEEIATAHANFDRRSGMLGGLSFFFHDFIVLAASNASFNTIKPTEAMDNMVARSQNLVDFSYEFSALPEEMQVEKATELFMVLFTKFEPAELFCMANKLHTAEEFVGAASKLTGIQETLNNEKEHEEPVKFAPSPEMMSVADVWTALKPYVSQLGAGLISGLNSVSDFVYDIGANLTGYKEFTSSQIALDSAFIHEKANIKITERETKLILSDKSKFLFFGKADQSAKLVQLSNNIVNTMILEENNPEGDKNRKDAPIFNYSSS